ncbi:hypothetical protein GCM10025864_13510 [Luteimicrobium album]|uniref:Beta-galactosidase n=1 Tax=Luteimicrobium album TaxID=1054550 RepID=A0ABQ6HYW0_9MICO|nr:sugar-binding domain-containing protein [Luteimicrobium album]GMA23592.1 hypothetical protein GCM10025864_13510 [Luteimicrobium album]
MATLRPGRHKGRALARLVALATTLGLAFALTAPATGATTRSRGIGTPTAVAPARLLGTTPSKDVSLNGDAWQFKPVKMPFFGWEKDDSKFDRSFIRDAIDAVPEKDWNTWTDVRVPMAWNSVDEFDFPSYYHYLHKGEYRRTFDVPVSYVGNHVRLHFEGVDWKAWVYVNGKLAHSAGFEDDDFTHEFALTPSTSTSPTSSNPAPTTTPCASSSRTSPRTSSASHRTRTT